MINYFKTDDLDNPSLNIDSLTNFFLHLKRFEELNYNLQKVYYKSISKKFHEPNFKSEFISCKRTCWNV